MRARRLGPRGRPVRCGYDKGAPDVDHGAPRATESASASADDGGHGRFRAARRTTGHAGTRRPVEEKPCAVHAVHRSRSAGPGQARHVIPYADLTCAYAILTGSSGSAEAWFGEGRAPTRSSCRTPRCRQTAGPVRRHPRPGPAEGEPDCAGHLNLPAQQGIYGRSCAACGRAVKVPSIRLDKASGARQRRSSVAGTGRRLSGNGGRATVRGLTWEGP
jgi:hypothetical protein